MAYLLANAARVRMSREHDRHVWWFTKEEYLEALRTDKTTAKQEEYAWIMRSPDSINHKFDPNCTQCEAQRQHRDDMKRRDAEESERYRIRQEEEKAKKKEKEREAAERRMMEAEDKPRTPPPPPSKPKSSLTPEQVDSLARYNKAKEELERQKEELERKIKELNVPVKDIANGLVYCKHCDIKFQYKCQMYAHIETRRHKMKAGMLETYPKTCEACEYTAKTRHKWEQHCEGAKHKIRMEGGKTKTSCEKCGTTRKAGYDWEKHKHSHLCVHWQRQKRRDELIASGMDKKEARDKAWDEIQFTYDDDEVQSITIPTTADVINITNESESLTPSSIGPLTNE